MSSLSKLFVLFTVALSVSGLATPHVARSPHDHRALAARMAAPAAAPAVGLYGDDAVRVVKPRRKRGDTGRCRAQSSSTVESTSSVFSSSSSSDTPVATTPVAVIAAAPAPSSTWTPEPTTSSSTPAPEPTTSEAPAPSSSSSSGSISGSFLAGIQTGQATWYDVGLGACGITNNADQKIAAVSHLLFDTYPGYDGANPNNNPVCNKQITLNYNGASTTVTVTDRCEACALTDLDLSISAFEQLSGLGSGRLSGMTWSWS